MPAETPHSINHVETEEEPDGLHHAETYGRAGSAETPHKLTWQEHLAIGDTAYSNAVAREEEHGLDEQTVDLYQKASDHLIAVTATGPLIRAGTISSEAEPADPIRLMKIGGSLSKQAQAAGDEFYQAYGSSHIKVKDNKQRIATETIQRASRMMMGEDNHAAWAAEFEAADESPADVVVAAVVEAAKETGTAEYVYGSEAVGKDTSERLEAEGKDAVAKFIGEHAMESGPHGLEFIARLGEIVVEEVEELTAEHKLPTAV